MRLAAIDEIPLYYAAKDLPTDVPLPLPGSRIPVILSAIFDAHYISIDGGYLADISVVLITDGDWRGGVVYVAVGAHDDRRPVARMVDGDVTASWIEPVIGAGGRTITVTIVPGTAAVPLGRPYVTRYLLDPSGAIGGPTPPPPTGFRHESLPNGRNEWSWTMPDYPDLSGIEIRYALTGGTPPQWGEMTRLHEGWLTESPWQSDVPGNGRYIVAARSRSLHGVLSQGDIRINATIARDGDARGAFVYSCPAAEGWPGSHTGFEVAQDGALVGSSGVGAYTWDTLTTWDAWMSWAGSGGTGYSRAAVYTTPVIDIGDVATWVFTWTAETTGTVTVEARTADTEAALTAAAWGAAPTATVTARWAQFRWSLSGDGTEQLRLAGLCYSLSGDVDEHLILDSNTATWPGSAAAGRRLPSHPFRVVSDVLLTLQSLSTPGWSWTLASKSPPTVQIWNGAGSPADALVDAIVRGIR